MILSRAAEIPLQSTATSPAAERGDFSVIDPLQGAGWDEMLARYSGASFFHSAAWLRALRAAYGHVPKCLFWKGRITPAAIVSMMEVRGPLFGVRGVSLPFSDFCEPLIEPGANASALGAALVEHGHARGWKYFECRGGAEVFRGARASTQFYVHRLCLSSDVSRLWNGCAPAVRRAIRKAEAGGLKFSVDSSIEGVRAFYKLQCDTRRKHGLPPQPESFFLAVHQHVIEPGFGTVFLARHGDVPVAAALFTRFGRRAVFKYGASDERNLNLRGNNLVMWRAIAWHAEAGFDEIHFGRTSMDNEGLRRYKLGFGAEEKVLDYFRYDYRKNDFVTVKDATSSSVLRSVFRLMPPGLSRLCGALLYSQLA
jgi:hypothetical protein